jgi:penicillin-insensitive murein DD-endopeptidase
MKKKILILLILICLICAYRELFYQNKGKSRSEGDFAHGKLENAYLFPFSGNNYSYFSIFSYYIMDNAYMHSKMYNTIQSSYKTCEETCEGIKFKTMECANKEGGKMAIHRTHQLGLSADFMVVKKNKAGNQSRFLDYFGMAHYLHGFDSNGSHQVFKNTQIDFETCAKHILALDDAAKKNGLKLSKVILKLDLHDNLFATPSGKEIKRRDIYFAQWMPTFIDNLHDDHYHVDFIEL